MRYLKEFNEYILEKSDPKVGTGKKPKGSSRRLYTDENPKDTVSVKFRTLEDIRATINSPSFKSKSHKRQSQILNLIEQRVRVAHGRAKDPETKRRLKRAHDYIKSKCEKSKEKTKRLNESIESTEQDLKDILLELKDMGYRIIYEDDVKVLLDPTDERDVTGKPGNVKAIIVRDLMRPSDWIDLPWSELKEYALRIKDYLGDKYLSFQWRKVVNDKTGENPYKTIELNEMTEINDRVWSFVIKYKE